MAIHSSILTCRINMDRGTWQVIVHGVTKSPTRLSDFYSLMAGIPGQGKDKKGAGGVMDSLPVGLDP